MEARPEVLEQRSLSVVDPGPPGPGTLLAERYRLVREIGAGGMAKVYEAEHVALGLRVAVKVMNTDLSRQEEMRTRFLREARLLGRMRSEHVVAPLDVGLTDGGSPFLVMELLEGKTLRALLREERELPLARAAALCIQLCHGLSVAHSLNVVHRDLKPENVFLCRRSDGMDWVKILDFGIAKLLSNSPETLATEPARLLGTPCYMSPERVANGLVSTASDVHSVGLILYECLAGRPAFSHPERIGVLLQVLQGPPPDLALLRPELASGFVELVNRALDPVPERRFRTAAEMARELSAFAAAGSAPAPLESDWTTLDALAKPSVRTQSSREAHRGLAWVSRVALAAAAGAVGVGAGLVLGAGISGQAMPAPELEDHVASRTLPTTVAHDDLSAPVLTSIASAREHQGVSEDRTDKAAPQRPIMAAEAEPKRPPTSKPVARKPPLATTVSTQVNRVAPAKLEFDRTNPY